MINKLIIDGNNVELNESSKMPYTHTFQQAKTHEVKFGLDNTNEICAYAFKDCTNLTKIEIPETIVMLKRGAFMNCSNLPAITLNKNIEYIGNQCFDGCTKLTEIKFEGDEERKVPEVYCKIPNQTTIYVPDGSKYEEVEFDKIDQSGDIEYYTLSSWGQYLRVEDLSLITASTTYYRNRWDAIGDNGKIKENKNRKPVTKLSFDEPTFSSTVGKTEKIYVNVLPEDCTNLNFTWTTTDTTALDIQKDPADPKSVWVTMLREDNSSTVQLKCQAESGISTSVTFFIAKPKAAKPTFSVEAGEYTEAKSVIIASETSGADIYYTTNGTNPTASSTKYTGAITVDTSMTIKAIAIKDGYNNSDIATVQYTINIPESTEQTEG